MDRVPVDVFVAESEIRLSSGLPLDPDFIDRLRSIELDTSVSHQVRVRAALAATNGVV